LLMCNGAGPSPIVTEAAIYISVTKREKPLAS
jgi:hypothetical protein